jgi:hypothetical protein
VPIDRYAPSSGSVELSQERALAILGQLVRVLSELGGEVDDDVMRKGRTYSSGGRGSDPHWTYCPWSR